MRTARQLKVVAPDPIDAARAVVETAATAAAAQAAEVERLAVEKLAATEAYDGDESLADAAGKATAAHERATRLLAKRQAEEAAAREQLRSLEHADDEREAEQATAFVEGFASRLMPSIERLEKLREQLWQERETIADIVMQTQNVYDQAEHLAAKLERPAALQLRASRPTILDAQLLANAAIALSDKRAARDECDDWALAVGPESLSASDAKRSAVEAATRTIEALKGQR